MKDKKALTDEKTHDFESLVSIMEILRGENGCPWDRAQTHESVRRCLVEETCEVLEALDTRDSALLREELGDLLFQIVFHARLEEEAGRFSAADVIDGIAAKMIRRHPHVFAGVNPDEFSWDEIKKEEKDGDAPVYTAPPLLPSVLRAQKAYGKIKKKTGRGYNDIGEALAAAEAAAKEQTDKAELAPLLAKAAFALSCAAEISDIDLEAELCGEVRRFTDESSR